MDTLKVLERIRKKFGFNKGAFASQLGITASDFSNRLKRDTLLPLIVKWAIHENVNLQWLLTGELSMTESIAIYGGTAGVVTKNNGVVNQNAGLTNPTFPEYIATIAEGIGILTQLYSKNSILYKDAIKLLRGLADRNCASTDSSVITDVEVW